ncbi:hypothetical protein AB6A40_000699 [Gnathostoma spinigerum]|uniref:Uncharacterized protein n=1 Tax=Gnathostoma spinigerum TaxID=75299 RepID=A0ABD6E3L2_9BILA
MFLRCAPNFAFSDQNFPLHQLLYISNIKPDFDTDVLWRKRPNQTRNRTFSTDSTDSESGRRLSVSDSSEASPSTRKFSLTEVLFGKPGARKLSTNQDFVSAVNVEETRRKSSIVEDERFRQILRNQKAVFGDSAG